MVKRILSLAFLTIVGCSAQNDPSSTSSSPQTSAPDPTVSQVCGSPAARVCSDAQVMAISMTSDAGEVALAKSVRDRLATKEARDFADKMIVDHSKMLADAQDLAAKLGITPMDNGVSKELKDEADMEMTSLAKKSGMELDQAYIDHEVVDHLMDLGMGDHLLIPSAKSAELQTSLLEDRAKIAMHYTMSLNVQAAIEGTCGGATTTTDDPGE
jgi:putative membrane protein